MLKTHKFKHLLFPCLGGPGRREGIPLGAPHPPVRLRRDAGAARAKLLHGWIRHGQGGQVIIVVLILFFG